MTNEYGLQELQEANLELLEEIDRICRKYGIEYMLDSGTLLGCVRHQGFIPWDDDTDICMRRSQWEKFVQAAPAELPEDMHLLLPSELAEDNRFYDYTPRLCLLRSERHEPSAEDDFYHGYTNRVWVDIFIQDEIPDNRFRDWLARFRQKLVYLPAMGHRHHLDYGKYSLPHKIAVGVCANLGKLISMKTLCRWQDRWARSEEGKGTRNIFYSNYQPDYLYVTLEQDWAVRATELPFEGRRFMVPEKYHEILTEVYGDYMRLPDPENRVPSHGSREIKIFPKETSGNGKL